MPHVDDLSKSKYVSKADVRTPIVVTIRGEGFAEFERNGEVTRETTLLFNEIEKPLVLKPECAQGIAAALGEDWTEKWVGKQIELFIDESVSYAGKRVGGVRGRQPSQPSFNPAQNEPEPQQVEEEPIINQAFFEFETFHADKLPDNCAFLFSKFKEAVEALGKGTPTRKESIPIIRDTVNPEDVWEEVPF
jgi:hypothetical protein